MCSINNYEIIDNSSITARGVTITTSGEVVIILSQYTYHGKNNNPFLRINYLY